MSIKISQVLATSVVAAALALAVPLAAEQPGADPEDDRRSGAVFGQLVDAESGAAIRSAHVRLRGVGRNELSHRDGSFHFAGLAAGRYTISAQHIGYAPAEQEVSVEANDTVRVTVEMRPSALSVAGVVVTGTGRERGGADTYQPTSVIGDAELRRRLGSSIAATIDREPGIHQQYNGPAASQPLIRGMGGDRVLMLEDGLRTGDLSTTTADHAVTIDPLTAERIEVVRGPAGLLYGSNALGGVINVIREEVPRTLPERLTGTVSVQVESVNRGMTGGASAILPLGRLVVRGEFSARSAGETRTPLGTLESTQMAGINASAGASWITSWGFAGASYRDYTLDHGVPGEFNGELIPGAHEGGVSLEYRRQTGRFEAGHMAGIGPFSSVELEGNFVQYYHEEIEDETEDGARLIGASFDQLLGTANLVARHDHDGEQLRNEGAVGLSFRGKDLITGGSSPGSRSASEYSLAGYLYEEFGWHPFRLQAGVRYDRTRLIPHSDRPIRVGQREVPVRTRDFGSVSGSVAGLYELMPGWTVGVNVARAFRTPAIEELLSDGPHLATFSFEIGNPDLEPEVGFGTDVFVRASLPDLNAEVSVFRNAVRNYIYYEATGEADPRFRRFPVFEARGDDAVFLGAEGRVQWEAVRNFVLDGTLSAVQATRVETTDPLPSIPPVTGSLRGRYEGDLLFASLGWDGAAPQNRVPRSFESPIREGEMIQPERPTGGYGLLNAGIGVRWAEGERFHTVTLEANNLTDAVWRDHLSRIKDVAPQPGRNLQLLYRVNF